MSRRRHAAEGLNSEEEEAELNLTPYLDIITTLVIFMVFTFQVVIEFRLIELVAPALGGDGATDQPLEKPIVLTLIITDEGYRLTTDRPELIAPSEIPKKPDGVYDTVKLKSTALMFKEKLKLGETIVLMATDDIEYAKVIEAMDTIRSNDNKWLFPDVMFAQASLGGGG